MGRITVLSPCAAEQVAYMEPQDEKSFVLQLRGSDRKTQACGTVRPRMIDSRTLRKSGPSRCLGGFTVMNTFLDHKGA